MYHQYFSKLNLHKMKILLILKYNRLFKYVLNMLIMLKSYM